MKTLIALIILLALTFQATSQMKQKQSGTATIADLRPQDLEDLKLIIKSNELGKQAREEIIIQKGYIKIQDSLLWVYQERISGKNITIRVLNMQLDSLIQVHENDMKIIANSDTIIFIKDNRISYLENELKCTIKKNKKVNFWRTVAEIASAAFVFIVQKM